ncbi:MAG: hypothetical protein P8N02_05230, partial [Actinomycetota bacterium]|nr:hypothetical protein [Actinomycetota bacterium]
LIVVDVDGALDEVRRLVLDRLEIARLGFEARAAVAEASWDRVLRALTLRGLGETPVLDGLGARAARALWSSRLGSASAWGDAELSDDLVLTGSSLDDGRRIELGEVAALRRWSLRRGVSGVDVDNTSPSGTLRHHAPRTPTSHAPES